MADIEALTSMLSGLKSKSAYSQLKPLMPLIDRKIKEGVRRSEIHEMLTAQGIDISAGSFYTYLSRYRKKHADTMKSAMDAHLVLSPGDQGVDVKPLDAEQEALSMPAADATPHNLFLSPDALDRYTEQYFRRPPLRRNKT